MMLMLIGNTQPDALGLLPYMLRVDDPRPAREQFDAAYGHGGGWRPMEGFKLLADDRIKYPGDPALKPIAMTWLHDETVLFYDYSWVVIRQPDGSFEVARMD